MVVAVKVVIDRQSRRILETTVSTAELLEKFLARGKFLSRRFRVEGSVVGASRLLNLRRAEESQAKYGGQVVELVTKNAFLTAQAARDHLPSCRRTSCGAKAGEPCRGKNGLRGPHAVRLAGPTVVKEPGSTRRRKKPPDAPAATE